MTGTGVDLLLHQVHRLLALLFDRAVLIVELCGALGRLNGVRLR